MPCIQLKLIGNQSLHFLSSLIRNGFPSKVLDISEVKFVTPVICVLCEVAQFLGKRIIYPRNFDSFDYLSYMKKTSTSSSRYISTFNVSKEQEILPLVKQFKSLFKDWLTPESCYFMEYALNELIENVFYHAQSQPGLWIQAQKYPNLGTLEVALADLGRGITESMRDNPIYQKINSDSLFLMALNIGVTSKPEEHSGEGLSCVLEWIKRNPNAEGILISLDNTWYKIKDKVGWYHADYKIWPGTFLWLEIPREPQYSLLEVWNDLGLKPE